MLTDTTLCLLKDHLLPYSPCRKRPPDRIELTMPRYMARQSHAYNLQPARERTPRWELNDEASTGSPMLPQRAPRTV
ncbi:UNVERIFIED_CONTAM: hypothetical protein Slati_3682000 [Sesamum latifolium]|uniref:Uncharacterized protein n=1 Tax=Sesamum latifolium TaxID=2727402 RepID=A0AAW2U1P7_9LAMI